MNIMPWLEVNEPSRKWIDRMLDGLARWRRVTLTAIITTTYGHGWLYGLLRDLMPSWRIIPGLKTSSCVTSPLDRDGWFRVAEEIKRYRDGVNGKYVLENETLLKPYYDTGRIDSWGCWAQCVAQLPVQGECWWYPGVLGSNETVQRRYCELVENLCRVHPVRFIDRAFDQPVSVGNVWMLRARDYLLQLPGTVGPPIQMIYCYADEYWPDSRLAEALTLVGPGSVIVYPGQGNWIHCAEAVAEAVRAT